MKGGFTLVELVVVIMILVIVILIVVATINPVEQFNRARDSASEANARTLLSAIDRYMVAYDNKFPDVIAANDTDICTDMVSEGPVYEFSRLKYELTDWFMKEILQSDSQLYVGHLRDHVKICYQVRSVKNIKLATERGCNEGYLYFNCIPY